MKQRVYDYFDAWNSFDPNMLRNTLHRDVTLTDWEINVTGIEAVLEANRGIQMQFPEAKIEVMDIAFAGTSKAFAQITIDLASGNLLNVVDVFEFRNDKICKIFAYKK